MVSDKKRRQIVRLGKKGLRLREISKEEGISIPTVSEILRAEGVKSHFYVEYEARYGRAYKGHHGRPVKSDFPRGYVTSSEAARILEVDRSRVNFLLDRSMLEGYTDGPYRFVSLKSIPKYVTNIFKDAVRRGKKIRYL